MTNNEVKHVFVSYVHENKIQVDKLCQALDAAQIPYWRDRKSLDPGDQWRQKISEAIRSKALVFLACFSKQSEAKAKSYMNEEITLAIEELRQFPPDATWLIPVRFDNIDIPQWELSAGRTLRDLNYANLYGKDYQNELVRLMTTISRVMGIAGPGAATLQASIEEADDTQRPEMMRRTTKEMILDPAKRIELDDLISKETQRILLAMRNEDLFPTQHSVRVDADEHLVRCVQITDSYQNLVAPLCASLQVAGRWGDAQGLAPWVSALKAISSEAARPKGGSTDLISLRHVPALIATFTVSLAATGQGRWDNVRTLLMDVTLPSEYGGRREPLLQAEHPWKPFHATGDFLPNLVARVAVEGEEPRAVIARIRTGQGKYFTPTSEWLHTVVRKNFLDQYPDEDAFDEAFERSEIMLGLISQDLADQENVKEERGYPTQSHWYGRSVWRAKWRAGLLDAIAAEIESQQNSWAPLAAGLFGGNLERAATAMENYKKTFNELARRFF